MDKCIFCMIANGEIPTNKAYEDDKVIILDAFVQVNNNILLFIFIYLTCGPAMLPAAGHMQMQVRYALSAVLAGIDDQTEALLCYAKLIGKL